MRDLGNLLSKVRENVELEAKRTTQSKQRRVIRIGGEAWRKRVKEEKQERSQQYERELARKRAQRKYYLKNKQRLNRERALRGRLPRGVYNRAKARALRRGQDWNFTYEDWLWMWENAPRVWDHRKGFYNTAWALKGGNYNTDTQMCRSDTEGPWCVENCFIGLRGKPLEDPEDVRTR